MYAHNELLHASTFLLPLRIQGHLTRLSFSADGVNPNLTKLGSLPQRSMVDDRPVEVRERQAGLRHPDDESADAERRKQVIAACKTLSQMHASSPTVINGM